MAIPRNSVFEPCFLPFDEDQFAAALVGIIDDPVGDPESTADATMNAVMRLYAYVRSIHGPAPQELVS